MHDEFESEDQLDVLERVALRRAIGLSTELEDITEVEYRQLRLERVVMVGIYAPGFEEQALVSLQELAALADTAGAEVLGQLLQKRAKPDKATYIGLGKAQELAELVSELGADTVIADDELAPSTRRALEDQVKVKVIDRTALILDIFAQHAKSKEGKAQVELAQLQYLLPRLRGWGESMSRQAGGQVGGTGMGSRGPGETKIELDRRRINTRIAKLRKSIATMKNARDVKRSSRTRFELPSVAIVGYTNAGKSSLLNALTDAGVMVQNALFATLDPTTRRTTTATGREYLLSDTVGFVRKLPHQLVEAFRSSLEEVEHADLILHVVDASHDDPFSQIDAVREVLADVPGFADLPELIVVNKFDLVSEEVIGHIRAKEENVAVVSAHTNYGIDKLRERIEELLPQPRLEVYCLIPYDRGDIMNKLHETGIIHELEHRNGGTFVHAQVSSSLAQQMMPFTL